MGAVSRDIVYGSSVNNQGYCTWEQFQTTQGYCTVYMNTARDNPGILYMGAVPVTNLLIHELNDASIGFFLIYRKSVVKFEI